MTQKWLDGRVRELEGRISSAIETTNQSLLTKEKWENYRATRRSETGKSWVGDQIRAEALVGL